MAVLQLRPVNWTSGLEGIGPRQHVFMLYLGVVSPQWKFVWLAACQACAAISGGANELPEVECR